MTEEYRGYTITPTPVGCTVQIGNGVEFKHNHIAGAKIAIDARIGNEARFLLQLVQDAGQLPDDLHARISAKKTAY